MIRTGRRIRARNLLQPLGDQPEPIEQHKNAGQGRRREKSQGWVAPIRCLAEQADRVHVLMYNCYGDYGVRNARQLAELLAGQT